MIRRTKLQNEASVLDVYSQDELLDLSILLKSFLFFQHSKASVIG